MSEPVITIENLGKKYRLKHQAELQRYTALRDVIAEGAKRLFRRSPPRKPKGAATMEDFWALNDVSLEIKQGEVVGIIGRNGAGKSTLLKILSRITEPTTGSVRIRGRVASLLEVGTGFHPELTGRENIYLNGAILGMSRAEIRRKFDEIVAFAEVEKFLDTPVKRYSSGMYVRLAFAVAAHLEPETLVVDEVLAVGDAEFQKKCLGKMEHVSKEHGRTVLFVSHNMAAVRALCSRAILLRQGKLLGDSAPGDLIESYLTTDATSVTSSWERPQGMVRVPPLHIMTIEARLLGRQPRLQLAIEARFVCVSAHCPKVLVAVDLCDSLGVPLMQAEPHAKPFMELGEGAYVLRIQIELPPLIPGRYTADVWLGSHYTATMDRVKNAVVVNIEDSPTIGRGFPHYIDHGHIVPPSRCQYEKLETGPREHQDICA